MRTLSTTLRNAQQASSIQVLVRLQLTYGANTYTYENDRILQIKETENGSKQSCEVVLDNSDKSLLNLDFKGYKGTLSFGAVTSEGNEYSSCAPMYVIGQRFDSAQGKLICTLSLVGICNLMADDVASEPYMPDEDDTKTIKTLINEIAGATLACFNHCTAYDVVWDSEDNVINSYKPKDSFRIYTGSSRLSTINKLLDLTKCVMRAQNDGKLHIFVPTTSGTTYDYEYNLESGHTFFAKAYRNRLVVPNRIVVKSREDDDPQYQGIATDDDSYNRLPKTEYHQMFLESNTQAENIAQAILSKAQMWSEAGSAEVPINVGAEVYDYVHVTDQRQNDSRTGNIGKLTRTYTANKNEWRMSFVFGNWQNVRMALAELGITQDDLETSFPRLRVGSLYAEHILAKNCDFVWLDPDNTIDLSKIGDNLDNLPDGDFYVRAKSQHLDATGTYLREQVMYRFRIPDEAEKNLWKHINPPSNPSTGDLWIDTNYTPNKVKKWTGSVWQELTQEELKEYNKGVIVREVKDAALTADGLVLLDHVSIGDTYDLIYKTDISAHHIKLSSTIQDSSHRTVSDSEKSEWSSKIQTYRQSSPPSGANRGDLWFDSNDGYKVYRWSGSSWQPVRDEEISELRTDITQGYIHVSEYTVLDGAWRPKTGVKISATEGIVLYGTGQALHTRASETGTDQCYVGSDGAIYAGGDSVKLDSSGITLKGDVVKFYDQNNNYRGGIFAAADCLSISTQSMAYPIILSALRLDVPLRSSDPTKREGGVYYNTSRGKFCVCSTEGGSLRWWDVQLANGR